MSYDLVKRLRNPPFGTESSERNLMTLAADALDTQAAEITRLGAACDAYFRQVSLMQMRHARHLPALERRIARQRRALAKLYERRHDKNAALATARREGMEKAAQIGDWHIEIGEVLAETEADKRLADNIKMQVGAMKQVVGAILAAAGEGK